MDSEPGRLQERIGEATTRLTITAAGLTDSQAREPSQLPGWTRGHVLTHIARNADGLRNLLIWARTGVVTPQYPDLEAREAGIAAGAGERPRWPRTWSGLRPPLPPRQPVSRRARGMCQFTASTGGTTRPGSRCCGG